ncbi:hypothetical protein EJ03DRAFT_44764 [Teratosphaeria nubilosa]|uniref:Uncharacterized protein n=1 Tax=Teratosphaeria nubilosa TaxID=161662 RepID=A0A6G1LDT6_9PEZI|nr:hypothetical protein EJ03DRAFT_44764 [Teratosphaeria nubilosa]
MAGAAQVVLLITYLAGPTSFKLVLVIMAVARLRNPIRASRTCEFVDSFVELFGQRCGIQSVAGMSSVEAHSLSLQEIIHWTLTIQSGNRDDQQVRCLSTKCLHRSCSRHFNCSDYCSQVRRK